MDSDGPTGAHARASVLDILHLGAKLGVGLLRRSKSDPAATVCRWARDAMERQGAGSLDVAVPGLPLTLVGDRERSEQILRGRPGLDGYRAGKLKTEAMNFLAPGALTIANGDAWVQLRPFNERVLGTGGPHPFAQTIHDHARAAFARPVANRRDVASAMGRAMVKIVVGDLPPNAPDLAADVTVLFDVVQSPLRRKLLGFLYHRRRRRLYRALEDGRARAMAAGSEEPERTLLALTREGAADIDRDTLLQQVPHWMFTFTGSGTDLLTRTLCLVTSRENVYARVLEELGGAGPTDRAETVERLAYLEACVLETGRLFPPVTRTFHRRTDASAGKEETAHFLPLLQRDDALGPTVHEFRPERWLAPQLDAPAAASDLFLRGARACPGMDLILFVIKAAAARQLGELGLSARQERLARDPLPLSFPTPGAQFTISRKAQ